MTVLSCMPGLLVKCALLTAAAATLVPSPAAPKPFSFEDPKKVNSVQWVVDSPLEPIAGSAAALEGTVVFDPDHPEQARGKIVIPTTSVIAPVALMTTHLQSDKWLDAAKYPAIEFEITGVKLKSLSATPMIDPTGPPAPPAPRSYWVDVDGVLSLHGVKRPRTISVEVIYSEGGLAAKMHDTMKGDVLRLRTAFTISRKEFGIDGGAPEAVVGDTIEIRAAVVALSKQP